MRYGEKYERYGEKYELGLLLSAYQSDTHTKNEDMETRETIGELRGTQRNYSRGCVPTYNPKDADQVIPKRYRQAVRW